jgi:hypothetical protein
MFLQPGEARAEVSPSAANRIEMNLLDGLKGLHLVHLGIEVENMHSLGSLALDDGTDLSLKEAQQSAVH